MVALQAASLKRERQFSWVILGALIFYASRAQRVPPPGVTGALIGLGQG